MVVTPVSRNLLVQLQIGQTSAGKPKLHNRAYPHVDVNAGDAAIDSVLTALAPLFADPIYAMGHVDTVQLQNTPPSQTTGTTGTTSGSVTTGGSAGTSGQTAGTSSSGSSTAGGATAAGTSTTGTAAGSSGATTSGSSAAAATSGSGGSTANASV